MKKSLPKYKFLKLSTESAFNAVRLHFDSILLYKNKSYPTAFHIAVLTMEEIAKSNWIDHYYETSPTNQFPDADFEQQWLQLLYIHTKKQNAYAAGEMFEYSPKFLDFLKSGKLELKKQKSIYVGLERIKGKINTKSRISTPNQIKEIDARQMISLNNKVLTETCKRNIENGHYYGPEGKYHLLNEQILVFLENDWKHKSGLKGKKWFDDFRKKNAS